MNTVYLIYINNAEQDTLAILNNTIIAESEPSEETERLSPCRIAHQIAMALKISVNELHYTIPDEDLEYWTYDDVLNALLRSGEIAIHEKACN